MQSLSAKTRPCLSAHDTLHADLDAIINAVEKLSRLTVQQFHAESGGGQYELAMAHTDAAACADALLLQVSFASPGDFYLTD